MLKISGGKVPRAQKVALYGTEGSGKTTTGAHWPDPVFIDTEGGTAHMDVRRIDGITSWEKIIPAVLEIAATPGICKTLIIDTLDWAEQMCIRYICEKYKQNSLEGFGYGRGYTYLAEEFARLLAALDTVIAAGIHVVVIAHAKMRKFEQPDEQGAYDRWEMKLTKQVAPLVKEWCDLLLFVNYKTYVVTTETNSKKAQGGKRVMYTTHHPCWDAKNRHGLPDELPLDYAAIAHIFEGVTPVRPVDQLRKLLADSGITEDELMKVVSDKGHYAADAPIDSYEDKFISGWCIKHFDQIKNVILAGRESLPENKEG